MKADKVRRMKDFERKSKGLKKLVTDLCQVHKEVEHGSVNPEALFDNLACRVIDLER